MAVVTARVGEIPVGMTINSFASVSLDPPLVLWSIREASRLAPAFVGASGFAINVLSTAQVAQAQVFAADPPVPSSFSNGWKVGKVQSSWTAR